MDVNFCVMSFSFLWCIHGDELEDAVISDPCRKACDECMKLSHVQEAKYKIYIQYAHTHHTHTDLQCHRQVIKRKLQ